MQREKTFVLFSFLRISDPQSPLPEPQTPFSSLGTLNFLSVCLGIDSLSILAWEIPWTEEPGTQSQIGLSNPHTHTHTHTHQVPGTVLAALHAFITIMINFRLGFPGGSVVKNQPAMQETWV